MLAKTTSHTPAGWEQLEDSLSPFTDYRHLTALEQTGCLAEATGWYPTHITVWSEEHCIAGFPLYLKTNSYGEFIFDHMWHSAFQRHGIPYFPKLVSSVPFTPATGSRLLFKPGLSEESKLQASKVVAAKISELCASSQNMSSHHVLFVPESEIPLWAELGYFKRTSFQYHWKNRGWKTFEEFLGSLVSKRRRQIVLERKQLREFCNAEDLKLHTATNEQLTPQMADFMFELYQNTNQKMGSHVCLTRGFFEQTFSTMKNDTVLFYATLKNVPIAAAINYKKGSSLFGRYWGTKFDIRNLHFELCYYMALDYCLDEKLLTYEAGAQGEHKFPRGFLPHYTYSCHKILRPEFHTAIDRFCKEEALEIGKLFQEYEQHSPYATN